MNTKKYEELLVLLRSHKTDKEILEVLSDYHENDIADMLAGMNEKERKRLYRLLGTQRTAEIFAYLDEPQAYFDELSVEQAARVVSLMDSDDAVDLLENLEDEDKKEIVEHLDEEAEKDVRMLLSYDDNQASITYDAVDTMRQLIDPNDLDTKRNQRFILNKDTNSKVFKLSDRTTNKEGRNIDFAIVDETHEMKTNVIGKSIEQSQSLKDNPKFINITTEGFVQDGYLDDELEKARKVVRGEDDTKVGKRLLPWLYTQDSEREVFTNPKSWIKSNPTLGVIKKISYLEEQVELAKESKGDRIFVLAKDFNIKQNSVEMWLNLEDYNFDATYDLEEFRGAPCLGAVDLAETMDLCCAKVLLMKDDGKKYIHTMYFIPERKIEDDDDSQAGAKYADWARDGYITVTEGSDIDLTVVADWFWSLYKEYGIRLMCCGYDQKFAKDFLRQMSEYGWTKEGGELELILQNAMTLDTANKFVETDLKKRNINYNNNPVDRWCFGNAGLSVDNKGKCLVVKTARNKKIDGAVTTVILYETYRRYRADLKRMVKEWRQSDGMAGEDNLES